MTYSDEEHIDNIMDSFDFEKVRKYMEDNDWRWGIINLIPTVEELKSTSLELLMNIKDEEVGYCMSTGGFTVVKCYDSLRLMFSIEDIDSEIVNLKSTYKKDQKQKERKEKLEVIDGISS